MAQYCSTADIQRRFPTVYSELTAIVDGYVTLSSGEIDGYLSAAHYRVPITGTVPDYIKELCILMTGIKLMNILYERQNSKVDGDYIVDLQRLVNDMIRELRGGRIPLALTRISGLQFTSVGDSLTTPDYSQHKIPTDFELNTEDMND